MLNTYTYLHLTFFYVIIVQRFFSRDDDDYQVLFLPPPHAHAYDNDHNINSFFDNWKIDYNLIM